MFVPIRHHSKALHDKSIEDIRLIQKALLEHYDQEKRELPWRQTPLSKEASDELYQKRAYEVWVSEIMLQQTKIAKVKDYYSKWMASFPTLGDLAKSSLEDVHSIWSGMVIWISGKIFLTFSSLSNI